MVSRYILGKPIIRCAFRPCLQFSTNSNPSSSLSISSDDKTGIATVTFQKSPVNSLNLEFLQEFNRTMGELEANRCRGLILTSGVKSIFSAGLDIMEMYKPNMERCKKFWLELQDAWITLYGSSFPSVAIINGLSPAGGCLLAMSCEYRIMLPNYTIGLNETQLGIVAPSWFIASMQNTIGRRQSEMALTTGRLFSTEEAKHIGLIDEIAENQENAKKQAFTFLQRFTKIPPLARSLTKQSVRGQDIQNLLKHRQTDLDIFINFVSQEKVQIGLEKYLNAMKKK